MEEDGDDAYCPTTLTPFPKIFLLSFHSLPTLYKIIFVSFSSTSSSNFVAIITIMAWHGEGDNSSSYSYYCNPRIASG